MAGKETLFSFENAQVMKGIAVEAFDEENFKNALDVYM
jgi:hypothetical protein